MDEVDLVHSHDKEVNLLLVAVHEANFIHRSDDQETTSTLGLWKRLISSMRPTRMSTSFTGLIRHEDVNIVVGPDEEVDLVLRLDDKGDMVQLSSSPWTRSTS